MNFPAHLPLNVMLLRKIQQPHKKVYIATQRLAIIEEIASCYADSNSVNHSAFGLFARSPTGSLLHSPFQQTNKPPPNMSLSLVLKYRLDGQNCSNIFSIHLKPNFLIQKGMYL